MPDTPDPSTSSTSSTSSDPKDFDGSIILNTPAQIELFHLLQMKYALKIEIKTGLRHSRGSLLRLINNTLIRNGRIDKPFRTKATALLALEDYIEDKQSQLT